LLFFCGFPLFAAPWNNRLLLRVAAVNRASVRTKMHRRWIYCYDARRAAFWIKLILKRTKEAKPNGN
jgi:hypothetical protein